MTKKSQYYCLAGLAALSAALTACGGGQSTSSAQVLDQTYMHKYGVAVPADYWQSSGEDGAVVSTLSDGVVVTHSYAAGKLDGETQYSYPHSSQMQKSEVYQQGDLVKETEFYFDGTPKKETKYNTPENGQTTITTWYLSATPRSIERYNGDLLLSGEYFSASNQRDALVDDSQGTRLLRDDYGQLLSTDTIKDGQLLLRATYYPSGSPRETIPYKNGVVEGTKRTFNPAGDPNTVEEWVGGAQEGLTTVYQHGDKSAEVHYVNGEKQGLETRYRDGKTKTQEINWSAGLQHGQTTTFVGEVIKTEWYYKGKPTSKADYDYMSKKPVAK